MSKHSNIAKQYLSSGLSVIPTKEDKRPTIAWKLYQSERMPIDQVDNKFNGAEGIAIITGEVSGGLEVVDVDTKYSLSGTLWEELKESIPEDLYNRLVVAQTVSGGYHLYYRAPEIEGNLKLANRPTTEAEKSTTYKAEIEKGSPKDKAQRVADNDKVRVLVETRGEGGYVIAPPTEGYTYLQGSPDKIATFTQEERDKLLRICRSFDQTSQPEPLETTTPSGDYPGLSPFEDYNNRGDIVELLESRGWTVVSKGRDRIHLLRPGQTASKSSGNFHTGKRTLRVFSTSTEFSPDKAYSPAQAYTLLECSGDYKKAYRELLSKGYGDPPPGQTASYLKTDKITVTGVNKVNRETSVISEPGDSISVDHLEDYAEVTITAPEEATEEILSAIEVLEGTGKRVYIKQGEEEIRSYQYRLQQILSKYGKEQEQKGGLSDRDIDRLLEEVVKVASTLAPVDKDRFKKLFLSLEAIEELGISPESLDITVDRLTSTRAKEKQEQGVKRLLKKAQELLSQGEPYKALTTLDHAKSLKIVDKEAEFSKLLINPTEDQIRDSLANKPDSLPSGYSIEGEDLLLPPGALSVFCAPTSHGKTSILINLLLNTAQAQEDKEFYLFSYEEDSGAMIRNTLNTYIGEEISSNNRRSIDSYLKTGDASYIKQGKRKEFIQGKNTFIEELLSPGRVNINYVDYTSEELGEAILYLNKKANPGAIFIDYFQLLRLPSDHAKRTNSRQEELKEICIYLKDIAVETGLPIILGAQFNREVISPMRIHATNIGEAGDIERIANLIVGFWNGNFYPGLPENNKEYQESLRSGKVQKGTLYTEILKNRGGQVGGAGKLLFNGNTGKIENEKPAVKF